MSTNSENDDLGNEVTFSNVIKRLDDAGTKLRAQSIKTPAAMKIRDEVSHELAKICDLVIILRDTFADTAPTNLKVIAQKLKELNAATKEINASTKELHASTKESTTTKSYAAAVTAVPPKAQKQMQIREERAKIRREREKYEVSLTAATAPEATRKSLTTMTPKDITERFQRAIDTNIHHEDKPRVFGISKSKTDPDKVRIRCKTEEQAKLL